MRYRILSALLLLLLALSSGTATATPTNCSGPPYNDPNGVFCESFDDGQFGPAWTFGGNASTTIVSPGLNGTPFKVQFHVVHIASSCPEGQATGGDAGANMNFVLADGSMWWAEWWESWDQNFKWSFGCDPANGWFGSNFVKDFDVRVADGGLATLGGSFAQNRFLMQNQGTSNAGLSMKIGFNVMAHLQDANPPQFAPALGSTDCQGTTSQCYWILQNRNTGFTFNPGDTVHYILEVKSATYPNGTVRLWANNTLVMDYTGLQTCRIPTGCTINAIQLAGPQANADLTFGNTWWYDNIRFTRTNISPGVLPQTPGTPSNLVVN